MLIPYILIAVAACIFSFMYLYRRPKLTIISPVYEIWFAWRPVQLSKVNGFTYTIVKGKWVWRKQVIRVKNPSHPFEAHYIEKVDKQGIPVK